jgi:fermentation-respiration switch protein FrsA (DUF1100 family)
MSNMTRGDVRIPTASGDELDAWLYLPDAPAPHPTVVMAHGIGGVKAAGLAPFADFLARNGFAALVFDYRHWGSSDGAPRELLSIRRQRQDYRTALHWAAGHEALDASRIFAWGTSFAGMHIVDLAASEPLLAGAIAQCPLVDGLAALTKIGPLRALRLTGTAIIDLLGSLTGRPARYLPLSVAPGTPGVIATEDALVGLERLSPPDGQPWPNRITARSLLDVAFHRPVRVAAAARCPLLMVVAESDTMAPTRPAVRVAARAPRGELYRSRGRHYDVYAGGIDHHNVLRVELDFLLRHAGVNRRTAGVGGSSSPL